MSILVFKFPEWLANQDINNTYDSFTVELKELGMQAG
jgi:hypothetical protein